MIGHIHTPLSHRPTVQEVSGVDVHDSRSGSGGEWQCWSQKRLLRDERSSGCVFIPYFPPSLHLTYPG